MAILRLATLTPLVPLEELARRLEAIAHGGSAPPASAPKAASSTTRGSPIAPRASLAGAPDIGGLWEAVLQRVQEQRVSLYMALAAARPLGLDDGALRVGVENEALRRELNRKESLEVLRAIASDVAGRALQLEIGPLPETHAHDTPAAQAKRRTEETLADPLVQAAVEIFGAEVRGVRDRRV
jgi:hypothetical protein